MKHSPRHLALLIALTLPAYARAEEKERPLLRPARHLAVHAEVHREITTCKPEYCRTEWESFCTIEMRAPVFDMDQYPEGYGGFAEGALTKGRCRGVVGGTPVVVTLSPQAWLRTGADGKFLKRVDALLEVRDEKNRLIPYSTDAKASAGTRTKEERSLVLDLDTTVYDWKEQTYRREGIAATVDFTELN